MEQKTIKANPPIARLEKRLKGHKSQVTSVSITPDGTRIISGSWAQTIGVWDTETGRILAYLKGHTHCVLLVVPLPDSRRLLSCAAGNDHTLKLWDMDSGIRTKTLTGHSNAVTSVAITADGKRAVSGSYDKTLKYSDLETDQGNPCGKKIYVQLKNGGSYLRFRQRDNSVVFDVKNPRHLEYWKNQPVDVYLVLRDEEGIIRWINVTPHLRARQNRESLQLEFTGEKLDTAALLRVREKLL